MKKLSNKEVSKFLDDNGESAAGCIAIESTTEELSRNEVGLVCGGWGAFHIINDIIPNAIVRGWYDEKEKEMVGMIHIKCNRTIADVIDNRGVIRLEGKSSLSGFFEFEDE